jgi:hypothetical protein
MEFQMNENKYAYVVWIEYGNRYVSHKEIGGIFSTSQKAQAFRQEVWDNSQRSTDTSKFLMDVSEQ